MEGEMSHEVSMCVPWDGLSPVGRSHQPFPWDVFCTMRHCNMGCITSYEFPDEAPHGMGLAPWEVAWDNPWLVIHPMNMSQTDRTTVRPMGCLMG